MSTQARVLNLFIFYWSAIFSHSCYALNAEDVTLYTPYTKISVPPGESIDYAIDIINNGKAVKNVAISIEGFPKGWIYDLKSGGWSVSQISVLPGEKKNFSLRVEVPLQVKKGNYVFKVVASGFDSLPLTVIVSTEGTFKTELTSKQLNMAGQGNANFTFNADLKNRTADKQLYALMATPPPGWNVVFKVNYQPVTSVTSEANHSDNIVIEVDPPDETPAGTYKIPITAVTSTTSANLEFEAVITGTYKMELTTPKGLLSTNITAGDEKRIELMVRNTGSTSLREIKLESGLPLNWSVIFDPVKIAIIEPGKTSQVFATIKADKKAIAGDYVANFEARTAEATSKAAFRISVETAMIWGWVGVLIILVALGSVYYLFRQYGRR